MKLILLRLGIIPSIGVDRVKDHIERGKHRIKGREVRASHDTYVFEYLAFLEDKFNLLSSKLFKGFKPKTKTRHGWMDESYIYLPIRKLEEYRYKGKVYNLEVEKDNSFLTEFAAVHNCWTPWYGLFGSKGGFDSIEDCYEDQTKEINALETGLSADPVYCRLVSSLDRYQLISDSDAHSPWPKRIGREATVFDLEDLSYEKILKGIREGEGLWGTFEFRPEEGKYNYNGHRGDRNNHNGAKAIYHPKVTPKDEKCPICGRKLTIGVQDRVYQLADREEPKIKKNFKYFVPLQILIAKVLNMGVGTKTVKGKYDKLIGEFNSEYEIWLNEEITKEKLKEVVSNKITQAIVKVRAEEFAFWPPGYDGVYGNLRIGKNQEEFPKKLVDRKEEQKSLEDF